MEGVDDVGILGIHEDAAVVATLGVGNTFVIGGHMAPRRAAIVGAIQSKVADEVDAQCIRADRDRHGDSARERRQPAAGDLTPADAGIRGLVDAASGAGCVRLGRISGSGAKVAEHRCGKNDVRRACRGYERPDTDLIVDVQRLGPGRSPVGGAEDATGVALRLEEASQRRD